MFKFETAEAALTAYFDALSINAAQAWFKVLMVLQLVAHVDYGSLPEPEREPAAWEEFDVAVRGYGDQLLTGVLSLLWEQVPDAERPNTRAQFTIALQRAQAQTAANHEWLHEERFRVAEVNDPANGWGLPVAIPLHGPRMERWSRAQGWDPVAVRALLLSLMKPEAISSPPPKLRLL